MQDTSEAKPCPVTLLLVRLVVAHLDTLWAELIEHQGQRAELTQEDRHHPPRPSVIALMVSVCAAWKRAGAGAASGLHLPRGKVSPHRGLKVARLMVWPGLRAITPQASPPLTVAERLGGPRASPCSDWGLIAAGRARSARPPPCWYRCCAKRHYPS